MLRFDPHALTMLTAAALSIVSGVVVANTSKKMGTFKDFPGVVGSILFVTGWTLMAIGLSDRVTGMTKTAIITACAMIVIGVVIQKGTSVMIDRKDPHPDATFFIGLFFVGGWILLGLSLFAGFKRYRWMGPLAALLVLLSMTTILPWQRKGCYVDGPGFPMFMLAWGLIIFMGSIKKGLK